MGTLKHGRALLGPLDGSAYPAEQAKPDCLAARVQVVGLGGWQHVRPGCDRKQPCTLPGLPCMLSVIARIAVHASRRCQECPGWTCAAACLEGSCSPGLPMQERPGIFGRTHQGFQLQAQGRQGLTLPAAFQVVTSAPFHCPAGIPVRPVCWQDACVEGQVPLVSCM